MQYNSNYTSICCTPSAVQLYSWSLTVQANLEERVFLFVCLFTGLFVCSLKSKCQSSGIRCHRKSGHPGSILLADSIPRHENDPSLVQVFRREKSLAVSMNDFSKLLEHFTLFRTLATHGNRLPDDLDYDCLHCVQQCIKDGVLHYKAKDLHNMRKGNAAIPTDLDSPALATRVTVLLGIDKSCKGLVPYSLWYKPLATLVDP